MKRYLLIIDPQNDFCLSDGALCVPNADKDMQRLAAFISTHINSIDDIYVTLDQHLPLHIAHPYMWIDANGNNPEPFTLITAEDVLSRKWITRQPMVYKVPGQDISIPWAQHYTSELEKGKKFTLCIWPEHCLIGSTGAAVYADLHKELNEWQRQRFATVNYLTKGENFKVESYSAIKAEVEDPFDPKTKLNSELISLLEDPEVTEVIIAGEALSHCVASTVTDIANNLVMPQSINKFVILKDCCSSVGGFEDQGEQFLKEMSLRGMRIQTTKEF